MNAHGDIIKNAQQDEMVRVSTVFRNVPKIQETNVDVGQVGNLRRIGNPPGVNPELLTGRLPIGRRLPT